LRVGTAKAVARLMSFAQITCVHNRRVRKTDNLKQFIIIKMFFKYESTFKL